MPFSYSSELRGMVLDQIRAGRSVAGLARELGCSVVCCRMLGVSKQAAHREHGATTTAQLPS